MKNIIIITCQEGLHGYNFIARQNSDFTARETAKEMNMLADVIVKRGYKAYGCAIRYKTIPALARHFGNFLNENVTAVSTKEIPDLLSDCVGVCLIGMPAKAGTMMAYSDRTWTDSWFNYILNGEILGEIGLYANYFGNFNIPVLMVSGCEKACEEASKLLGDVITLNVKKARHRNAATSIPLVEAEKLFKESMEKALDALEVNKKVLKPSVPAKVVVEYVRADFCDEAWMLSDYQLKRKDALTLEKSVNAIRYIEDLII